MGAVVDIRPTVALLAEVIPTVVGGPELGIHRPPIFVRDPEEALSPRVHVWADY